MTKQRKEIQKRKQECTITLKGLYMYWKNGNASIKHKLIVFNEVIKSNLFYGLDTTSLSIGAKKGLGAFQMRRIRKIAKAPSTYLVVNRTLPTNTYSKWQMGPPAMKMENRSCSSATAIEYGEPRD